MLRSLQHTACTKPDNYVVKPIDHTYSREELPVGSTVTAKHWELAKRYEHLVADHMGMEYTDFAKRLSDFQANGIGSDPELFLMLDYVSNGIEESHAVVFGNNTEDLMSLETSDSVSDDGADEGVEG